MTKVEQIRLIARFMGRPIDFTGISFSDNVEYTKEILPKYDTDWNELMNVIEKICKTQTKYRNVDEYFFPHPVTFGMIDKYGRYMVRLNSHQLFDEDTLIEAAFKAVINFLEDYYEPNKT